MKFDDLEKLILEVMDGASCDIIKNRGNTAEGIFACGLAAKFIARYPSSEGGKIISITPDNIWNVVKRLKPTGTGGKFVNEEVFDFQYTKAAQDPEAQAAQAEKERKVQLAKSKRQSRQKELGMPVTEEIELSQVKDIVIAEVEIGEQAYGELIDPQLLWCFQDEYQQVADWCNKLEVTKFAWRLAQQQIENKIEILAKGVEWGSSVKTDVMVRVSEIKTGTQLDLPFDPNMEISLKTTSKQMGQKAGITFEAQEYIWGLLGIDISSLRKKWNKQIKSIASGYVFTSRDDCKADPGWEKLGPLAQNTFKYAAKQLKTKIKDPQFLDKLGDFVRIAAAGSNEKVQLVGLEGGYTNKMGAQFKKGLQKESLGVVLTLQAGGIPLIIVYSKEAGETPSSQSDDNVIIAIRSKRECQSRKGKYGFYPRTYVESGPYLKKLAGIRKGQSVEGDWQPPKERRRFSQKESLTITHGSHNILTEMIENLMSEE
tara:strand:+ start:144 stop:1598 length:1455 start_codon:yes stop_codon:yes gene_type:complete